MKMKNLFASVFILFIVLISSCYKNPEKILPMKEGTWKTTIAFTELLTGGVDIRTGHIIFKKDGTGSIWEDSISIVESLTWDYNKDSKIMTINDGGTILTYSVKDVKRNSERWVGISEDGDLYSDMDETAIIKLERE